jgi:hypothetical protein
MYRVSSSSLVLTVASILLSASPTPADDPPKTPKTSADMVKVAAEATRPDADGKQTVAITINIEKGWHIHANPNTTDKGLKAAQTVVTITGKGKPEVVKIDYPEGKLLKMEGLPDLRIYEGKVEIKAVVRRTKGDAEKLEIGVFLQADTDEVCMLPATVKLTAP